MRSHLRGAEPLNAPPDMSEKDALKSFLNWVYTNEKCQNEHYALILWSHGPELFLQPPPGNPTGDPASLYLKPQDLREALTSCKPPANCHLDIVGFDACSMSMFEMAYEIRGLADYMVASQEEIRQPILQQFLSTQFGSTYYELGQKYFREILNLINTNKRVATAWHRSKGPVWTRLALTAFNNPEFKVPLAVSGLPINESVERFVNMLKKFASPELRTDIERCEPHVSLLHEGMTMTEMMHMLGNQPLIRKEVSYYDLR